MEKKKTRRGNENKMAVGPFKPRANWPATDIAQSSGLARQGSLSQVSALWLKFPADMPS